METNVNTQQQTDSMLQGMGLDAKIQALRNLRNVWKTPCTTMDRLQSQISLSIDLCNAWNVSIDLPLWTDERFESVVNVWKLEIGE